MGSEGLEPPKAYASGFTVRLLCRSEQLPVDSRRWELNPQPSAYKADAPPFELRRRITNYNIRADWVKGTPTAAGDSIHNSMDLSTNFEIKERCFRIPGRYNLVESSRIHRQCACFRSRSDIRLLDLLCGQKILRLDCDKVVIGMIIGAILEILIRI